MPPPPTSPQVAPSGALVLLRAAAAVTAVAVLLVWSVGNPARLGDLTAGGDVNDLIGRGVGVAAWLCLGWLLIALMVESATMLPGSRGRAAASVARLLSPRVLRGLAQAVLGLSLAAGPLAATPAFAAGGNAAPAPAAADTGPLSSGVLSHLDLDRPASNPALTQSEPAAPRSPAVVLLDRAHDGAYVAPAPSAAPRIPTTDSGSTALLSGTANRDSDDTGYPVRRGDTLWDIAARHLGPRASPSEIARVWPHWYAANRATIGNNPDLLIPGEVLYAPA